MAEISAHAGPINQAIRIRFVRRRDFDAVRRNHQITYEEHKAREPRFEDDGPFIEDYLADAVHPFSWLGGLFSKSQRIVLVAEHDGEIAGHIAYIRHSNTIGPYAAFVGDISVAPEHRRSGLGRALVDAMEHREARAGTTNFAASIWPENKASEALFERLGYTPFEGELDAGNALKMVQKAIPFGTLPLTVTMAKSAALTLFVIAVCYYLSRVLFA